MNARIDVAAGGSSEEIMKKLAARQPGIIAVRKSSPQSPPEAPAP